MGQPGEAFVCPRLPHILQHVRGDNARKDGGLWFCKAQIMLCVSLGWGPVFTMGLNVSSGRELLKFHQYHLSTLGWTSSVVSPGPAGMCHCSKTRHKFCGYSWHTQLVHPSFHVYSSLTGSDVFLTLFLFGWSMFLFHIFAKKGRMTSLCICAGTGHKSYKTSPRGVFQTKSESKVHEEL